jgi:release factor glutamine methyltransferase
VLDLCAGSGAIGCAILKHIPNANVSFGEIDSSHLPTIEKNIRENNLDAARASARAGNLFEPFQNDKFHIIATNPPYIPENRELPESVSNYEPPKALFAGEDGLSLIRQIAIEAPAHLLPGGELWLECDSEHSEEACSLVRAGGALRAEVRNDQYGRARLVVAYYS